MVLVENDSTDGTHAFLVAWAKELKRRRSRDLDGLSGWKRERERERALPIAKFTTGTLMIISNRQRHISPNTVLAKLIETDRSNDFKGNETLIVGPLSH